jgi:uncharacterized protein
MEIPPPITPPLNTPPPPAAAAVRSNGTDKIWGILCHLSIFLGIGIFLLPLVVYLAMKNESEYVAANAREALNFHLSILIYAVCSWILCFVFIGFLLLPALALCLIIFSIVAAVKAADGGCYRYPLTLRLIK